MTGSKAGVSRVAISLRRDEREACAGGKGFRNLWTVEPAGLPTHLALTISTLLRLFGADKAIRRYICGYSSPSGLRHAAQECRATASALLGSPHHARSAAGHEPRRGSVQAIHPVGTHALRHVSDGTPVGSAIGIRQRVPFPRRGRCASTPGLHDRTPSGSSSSDALNGSSELSSPRGVRTFLGLRLRPRRSGALPDGSANHPQAARLAPAKWPSRSAEMSVRPAPEGRTFGVRKRLDPNRGTDPLSVHSPNRRNGLLSGSVLCS